MEYASNGKGNLGVALGAVGTGLNLLQGGIGLMNNGYNGYNAYNGHCNNDRYYVNKDEMCMMEQISAKDSEIALLKAERDSEQKMIEVYRQAHDEVVALRDSTADTIKEIQKEINHNRREQDMWNANQSVTNSHISSAIAVNSNSIAGIKNTLDQITMLKVPNSAVCPGWGQVTVSPTFANCRYDNGTTIA